VDDAIGAYIASIRRQPYDNPSILALGKFDISADVARHRRHFDFSRRFGILDDQMNRFAGGGSLPVTESKMVIESTKDGGVQLIVEALEQLPLVWSFLDCASVTDRQRRNRLWLIEYMWKRLFERSPSAGEQFSPSGILLSMKRLPELNEHMPRFAAIYQRARDAGHPAARAPTGEVFSASAGLVD